MHDLRTALVVFVVAPLVGCAAASPVDDPASASGHDTSTTSLISTSTVISRAQQWVDADLHYCQSAYMALDGDQACWPWEGSAHLCDRESNTAWNAYRSDCSGFVTWAWGLPPIGDGGYVTGNFAPFENGFSHVIAPSDLQPGDALNKITNEHIVLFEQWVVPGQSAMFMEEPGCSVSTPYAHEFTSNIEVVDGSGSGSASENVVIDYEGSTPFTAIRLDGVFYEPYNTVTSVVGANADGRLELFFIAGDNSIQHMFQLEPGGFTGWSGPVALGGQARSLALGIDVDGRLELFYVGTDNAIYDNFQTVPNGDWYGQVPLGGTAEQLAVGTNIDGRLELFWVGTDNGLYHDYQTTPGGNWSGAQSLGGQAQQLAVASNADGALELAYLDLDNELYDNHQDVLTGSWNGPVALGGQGQQVAIGQDADGRLEVLYIGMDNGLYDNYQVDFAFDWSGQVALGSQALQIATGQEADGRIDLFYIGTDNNLYLDAQSYPDGGFAGSSSLGASAATLASGDNVDGRLELFYLGTDGALYHDWETAPDGTWSGQNAL